MSVDKRELDEYYRNQRCEFGFASLCHMGLPSNLEGQTVLDIGSRRGKGVFKLSERVGAQGKAIGLEWVSDYVEEARQKCERAWRENGLAQSNMEFLLGYPEDMLSLGIQDSSIDSIFINSVLHLCAQPRLVMSEMHRVLKPGGLLIGELVFANGSRDEDVVEAARKIGNCIQAAPFKAEFDAVMGELGFADAQVQVSQAVSPSVGYKEDYTVEVAPSTETVLFESTVTHYIKVK